MANFVKVNQEIKKLFPGLDIEAVRGNGYVYFDGDDGFDQIKSIMISPTTVSTQDMIQLCREEIKNSESYKKLREMEDE